jgi:hypothetical protein
VQIQQPIAVEDGVPLRIHRKAGFHSIISFAGARFKEYLTNVQLVAY